jgi:heptosyltransferase-1
MKLLLLRLSSMGDVLHTLPAISDMQRYRPDVELHWLLEPAFAPLAHLHPAVTQTIPFGLRGYKKRWTALPEALRALRRTLREEHYDQVLDAQGLYKSALLGRLAGAPLMGFNADSAREPGATRLYQRCFGVSWELSAIQRNRQLFAQALDYPMPDTLPDYGLQSTARQLRADTLDAPWNAIVKQPFVMGFHGTTRENKEWYEAYWVKLAEKLRASGLHLVLPAGNVREEARAARIAAQVDNVIALPACSLMELAALSVRARAFIGMDTGLSYLMAALGLNGVTLYGPTAAEQFSSRLDQQIILQSPEVCAPCGKGRCPLPEAQNGRILCQQSLEPVRVWAALSSLLELHHE